MRLMKIDQLITSYDYYFRIVICGRYTPDSVLMIDGRTGELRPFVFEVDLWIMIVVLQAS